MNEIDAQASMLAALEKRWCNSKGVPTIGGWGWLKFDTSKVQFKIVKMDYPDLGKSLVKTPLVLREEIIGNPSGATITRSFDYSKETEDSYEWHITGGLKIGIEQKLKVGLPLVGEGEATASAEISLEAGSVSRHSETISWHDTAEIEVPPEVSVRVQALLSTGNVTNVPFTATVVAYGKVGCLIQGSFSPNNETPPQTNTWMWGDLDTGIGWYDQGLSKLSKLPLEEADRQFTVDGTFSGAIGFTSSIFSTPLQAQEKPTTSE